MFAVLFPYMGVNFYVRPLRNGKIVGGILYGKDWH